MKILLRRYGDECYVWKTAKYNENGFLVDGEYCAETQIVSIINDNRKNYIMCSSCGKIFPKRGVQWLKHKEMASSIEPCLHCRKIRTNEKYSKERRFFQNTDGTYTERYDRIVELYCHFGSFQNFDLDSSEALRVCKFRQCGDADATEIEDTFTQYPGLFDDIITVDSILDNGYEQIVYSSSDGTTYLLDKQLSLFAYVNEIGIVERFSIEGNWNCYHVWYSHKYSKLFTDEGYDKYVVWESIDGEERTQEIINCIAKFYK